MQCKWLFLNALACWMRCSEGNSMAQQHLATHHITLLNVSALIQEKVCTGKMACRSSHAAGNDRCGTGTACQQ